MAQYSLAIQGLLAWGFAAWEQVASDLKSLPWEFIHGDMNPENILVRGDRVTGLMDFGRANGTTRWGTQSEHWD